MSLLQIMMALIAGVVILMLIVDIAIYIEKETLVHIKEALKIGVVVVIVSSAIVLTLSSLLDLSTAPY